MRNDPQRLAWAVMLAAFGTFCITVIAVPLSARWLLNNSGRSQSVTLTLATGSAYASRPSVGIAEAVFGSLENLQSGTALETTGASRASLDFSAPFTNETLGAVNLYSDTQLVMLRANTPRFEFSPQPHLIDVSLRRGRLRASAAAGTTRAVQLIIRTPQANITLAAAGIVSVEVTAGETSVSVRDGTATVTTLASTLQLAADERTIVRTGTSELVVLRGQRNLVRNGNFAAAITDGWSTFRNRADAAEAPGEVQLGEQQGRTAVQLARRGINWAETGVKQDLKYDVRDLRRLTLHLDLWLAFQDLRNCGTLGTECPLMLRIEYSDANGKPTEWLQGFYYLASTDAGTSKRCVVCSPPTSDHQFAQRAEWYGYDSPNLLELFKTGGRPPVSIDTISLYASGHSFESYVGAVELLAED